MIEKLHGTTETVDFTLATAVRLYRNDTPEDFPLHWHIPGEIICPIENTYDVVIAGQSLTLAPQDVLIIGSSELHSIQAPAEGQRYILNFCIPFFEQFQEPTIFFSTLHPYRLLRHKEDPNFTEELFAILSRMENEYFGQAVYWAADRAAAARHPERTSSPSLSGSALAASPIPDHAGHAVCPRCLQ